MNANQSHRDGLFSSGSTLFAAVRRLPRRRPNRRFGAIRNLSNHRWTVLSVRWIFVKLS